MGLSFGMGRNGSITPYGGPQSYPSPFFQQPQISHKNQFNPSIHHQNNNMPKPFINEYENMPKERVIYELCKSYFYMFLRERRYNKPLMTFRTYCINESDPFWNGMLSQCKIAIEYCVYAENDCQHARRICRNKNNYPIGQTISQMLVYAEENHNSQSIYHPNNKENLEKFYKKNSFGFCKLYYSMLMNTYIRKDELHQFYQICYNKNDEMKQKIDQMEFCQATMMTCLDDNKLCHDIKGYCKKLPITEKFCTNQLKKILTKGNMNDMYVDFWMDACSHFNTFRHLPPSCQVELTSCASYGKCLCVDIACPSPKEINVAISRRKKHSNKNLPVPKLAVKVVEWTSSDKNQKCSVTFRSIFSTDHPETMQKLCFIMVSP